MIRLTVLACMLVCLLARPAAADPVIVQFSWDQTYGDLEFGSAVTHARITSDPLGEGPTTLDGPTGDFPIVDGLFTLVTGPLLDITPTRDDAVYTYAGGGSVSVVFDLLLPDGNIHHGSFFSAALGQYVIYGDTPGGGDSTEGGFGAGSFDRGTATLLGIRRHTLGGDASQYLDSRDQYPDPYRLSRSFGYMPIQARSVPEPPVWMFLTMAAGAVWHRLYRR